MQKMEMTTLRQLLAGIWRERSVLPALRLLVAREGRPFQIPLPGFRAWVTGSPETNRQILVGERDKLSWRSPGDPVTRLLKRGVLVVDGVEHDHYREAMTPHLSPGVLPGYVSQMVRQADRVTATWQPGQVVDMLVESRRIALLIVMESLFGVDFWDDMPRLWKPVLKAIQYISPGAWVVWPRLPRLGYRKPLEELDGYLYGVIQKRRSSEPRRDLLGHLIEAGLDDGQIRDQMLTLLIAGHDTTTALLAWTFFLLGSNPEIYKQLQAELDEALKGEAPATPSGWQPALLDEVIKEALRLYPPIHLGSRRAVKPLEVQGCPVQPGERLLYSIYLTHRDPGVWSDPGRFDPGRFARGQKQVSFAYVPFGGGPRSCVGAAFGMAEARLVLARLLQCYHFELVDHRVHAHMGATLEPRPGVKMRVAPRGRGEAGG